MKKLFLFSVLFIFFFLFIGKNYTHAVDCPTCTPPDNLRVDTTGKLVCGKGGSTPQTTTGCTSCNGTGTSGGCTGTNTGSTTGGISVWGSPGSGPSLDSVSNLLGINAPNNASKASFNTTASLIVSLLIIVAIVLSLFYLIWGGISWIASEGDKQKLQSARHKIVFALVGLVIVFISFFIINAVYYFLGLNGSI